MFFKGMRAAKLLTCGSEGRKGFFVTGGFGSGGGGNT
jgi:hypothetical protein